MTSPESPTVFIVDDNGRMGAAMQRLLKTVLALGVVCYAGSTSCGGSFQTLLVALYWMCDFLE